VRHSKLSDLKWRTVSPRDQSPIFLLLQFARGPRSMPEAARTYDGEVEVKQLFDALPVVVKRASEPLNKSGPLNKCYGVEEAKAAQILEPISLPVDELK
jgi:hypothetical protein